MHCRHFKLRGVVELVVYKFGECTESTIDQTPTTNHYTIGLTRNTKYSLEMALPTHGRVILNTTAGEIDIELWSKVRTKISTRWLPTQMMARPKETPKACRNFIALALEGVYSNALGHDLQLTSR